MLKKFFNKHHMLLSKYELEQVISEYDAMSMAYLRNPVENVELTEYVKYGDGFSSSSEHASWVSVALVTNVSQQKEWIESLCALGMGRVILGTTSFPSFQDLRRLIENNPKTRTDILLFRPNDKFLPILQLCSLVQELEDLDKSKYIAILDERVRLDTMDIHQVGKTIDGSNDGIVLPHHLICISENGVTTKSNALHYEHENQIYYVSSFDSGFTMDGATPHYQVMSPIKFVQMNHVIACSVKTFKKFEMMEYTFDREGSLFYLALDTGRCVFMTAPMAFSVKDKSLAPPTSKATARNR